MMTNSNENQSSSNTIEMSSSLITCDTSKNRQETPNSDFVLNDDSELGVSNLQPVPILNGDSNSSILKPENDENNVQNSHFNTKTNQNDCSIMNEVNAFIVDNSNLMDNGISSVQNDKEKFSQPLLDLDSDENNNLSILAISDEFDDSSRVVESNLPIPVPIQVSPTSSDNSGPFNSAAIPKRTHKIQPIRSLPASKFAFSSPQKQNHSSSLICQPNTHNSSTNNINVSVSSSDDSTNDDIKISNHHQFGISKRPKGIPSGRKRIIRSYCSQVNIYNHQKNGGNAISKSSSTASYMLEKTMPNIKFSKTATSNREHNGESSCLTESNTVSQLNDDSFDESNAKVILPQLMHKTSQIDFSNYCSKDERSGSKIAMNGRRKLTKQEKLDSEFSSIYRNINALHAPKDLLTKMKENKATADPNNWITASSRLFGPNHV